MALLQLMFLQLLLHLQPGCGSGASPHLIHVFYTSVSQPGQGLPQFTAVGYVDGLPIARYDSETRVILPQASWMKKMTEENPQYWDRYTQMVQQDEADLRVDLMIQQISYNQSTGFHAWQVMIGCDVSLDRPKGQSFRYGYDGRDYLSLDMETHTWIAADSVAQINKRKLDVNPYLVNRFKSYVEKTCAEWLQSKVDYGNEVLQRTEPPKMTVTRKAGYDNMETLTCRAHGFYPREIDMVWTRDGEVWMQDTFHGVLSPNSDGTYHAWLGIKIHPQDRMRFRCHVEHDSLPKPLDLAWEEPGAANLGLILGCIMGAVLLAALATGIFVYSKKRQDGYKAASVSDRGSDSSKA